MRPARSLVARILAVGLALLTSGCLFADKTAAGRIVHNAPKTLSRVHTVGITVAFSSRLARLGTLTSVPATDPGLRLAGVIDMRTGRAYYAAPGSPRPAVVFDGNDLYALIPSAGPTDARPWISAVANKKLTDFRLDPSAVPASLAAFTLRPTLLLDFLSGALTGSIHRVGTATVQGVETTEYAAKFDLEQALTDSTRVHYSQKQQDDLAKLFRVLGIMPGDLDPGAVWIDAQGNPRRILLGLRESPVQDSEILLTVDMQLTPEGGAATVSTPNADTVETVPSISQYLTPLKARLEAAR